jgi:endoglucanase
VVGVVLGATASCTSTPDVPSPPTVGTIADGRHSLYVDPDSGAAEWVREHAGDPRVAEINKYIAGVPVAKWFDQWNGKVRAAVDEYVSTAATAGKVPVIVGYNIVNRDCGQFSSGGADSPDDYREWAKDFADGIGDRAAIVVLEPDSLLHLQSPSCLESKAQKTRLSLLSDAVSALADRAPRVWVYLDGGDGHVSDPEQLASLLVAAGIAKARGFAVNVSNYNTTAVAQDFASRLQRLLATKYHVTAGFVIDTSRNGNGSNNEWCNPAGRKIGDPPVLGSAAPADARLWVKTPGESDGECGIAKKSQSGEFLPELALKMIKG